ncbi:MAG: hypothetical protein U1E17_05915 [Geminicoccaceae bacterium]
MTKNIEKRADGALDGQAPGTAIVLAHCPHAGIVLGEEGGTVDCRDPLNRPDLPRRRSQDAA